jgi:hypothetical protein
MLIGFIDRLYEMFYDLRYCVLGGELILLPIVILVSLASETLKWKLLAPILLWCGLHLMILWGLFFGYLFTL